MFKNIVVALTANTAGLKAGLAQASTGVAAVDKQMKTTTATSQGLRRSLLAVGAAAALVVAGGLGMAVGKAVEFDREMRNVNSIAKESEEGFRAMSAQVLELSTQLPQSGAILAQGLYDIQSSGFAGADGMMVLEASATAAAAGLTETSVSAKAITSVLNAYGRSAADAGDVSDTLFKGVEVGVMTFEDLSSNLGSVIGMASAAGVEIDQVTSGLAAMTLAGLGTAEASTSLARVIQSIVDPSDDLANKFRELGFESGQAALDSEGLHGVMEMLRTSTDGSVQSWLALFPEIRAARGAFALTAAEGQNYADTTEAIVEGNNRVGATQEALNEQMKSLSAQWDMFKSSADAAAITVGTALLPVLIDVVNGVQSLAGTVGSALTPVIDRLWPAFGNVASVGRSLVSIIGDLVAVVGPLAGGLAALAATAAVDVLVALTGAAAAVVGWFDDLGVTVPLLASVLAVALLPSLVSVVTQFQVMTVMGLVRVIDGIASSTRGAAAAFSSLSLATAGVAALAALFAGAVMRARDLRAEAEDLAAAMQDAFGQNIDTSTAQGQVERLRAQAEGLREEFAELEGQTTSGFWDKMGQGFYDLVPGLNSAELEANALNDALIEAIEALEDQARHAEGTVNEVLSAIMFTLGTVDPEVIYEMADGLGIDLASAAREEAVPALIDAANAAAEAEGEFADLAAEFDTTAGAASRAAQAVKDYTDEIKAATDPVFAAQKAAQDHADALNDLNQLRKDGEATARDVAEAEREVARTLVDMVGSLTDLRDETGQLITSEPQLRAFFESMGAPPEVIDRIVEDFDMLQEKEEAWRSSAAPKVLAVDTEPVEHAMDAVEARGKAWEERKDTATADVDPQPAEQKFSLARALGNVWNLSTYTGRVDADTSPARTAFESLRSWINKILENPWVVRLRGIFSGSDPAGDGPGRGGPALSKVRAAMAGLPGLRVTSTYRTPERNRAVGGSPTSYHLDRSNPAVDVAGPAGQLDRLHTKLRSVPHRELIWRAPGHYDHLHFAAEGGLFNAVRAEQHVAQIANPGDWRVWAEPETGGEAYIPLAPSKRDRSEAILGEVARRFGYQMVAYAEGGINGRGRSGGGPGSRVTIQQNFHTSPSRNELAEARHQARIAAKEVGT